MTDYVEGARKNRVRQITARINDIDWKFLGAFLAMPEDDTSQLQVMQLCMSNASILLSRYPKWLFLLCVWLLQVRFAAAHAQLTQLTSHPAAVFKPFASVPLKPAR